MATAGATAGAGPERAFAQDLAAALDGAAPIQVVLSAVESGHLIRSRRVREGDPVVLFDGAGTLRAGSVRDANPKAAAILLGDAYPAREPARPVRIASALPEGGRADLMITAFAELGVQAFQPLTFRRSPQGREQLCERRAARWARLCQEALKVNGRAFRLEIGGARALSEWWPEAGPLVVLDTDPALPPLAASLPAEHPLPTLVIGPEGGLTDAERAAFRAGGCGFARLGVTALRIETAAMAAAAVAATLA